MLRHRFLVGALVLCGVALQASLPGRAAQSGGSTPANAAATVRLPPAEVDGLMAPVALYPDQLLAQMLLAAGMPARVSDLDQWLKANPTLKGTALQDAATQQGFEPPLIALVLFPQVVDFMAVNIDWTTQVGQAFRTDRGGVLDSVQRLRADALAKGTLESTPQQSITLKTVEGGQQVIVIEPSNPQVVYVPQYSSQTVYSQPPTTTVVVEESDDSAAVAAGVIGFTAGIAIGAAIDNDYYYGPYGWHGGPYMYGGAWDDYYDDREDAREDFYENREDARDDFYENRENMADSRGERASDAQQQRTERQQTRQQSSSAGASTQAAGSQPRTTTSNYEARGQDRDRASTATERSGTRSDAFSGYSSGKSERSASARGQKSRSGAGRAGGGRSGGGGRRR